jgi:hypothetical protein
VHNSKERKICSHGLHTERRFSTLPKL